jgi:hypothetical protein
MEELVEEKELMTKIAGMDGYQKVKWDYFHPFFNYIIEKHKYLSLKDAFFNKNEGILYYSFHMPVKEMTMNDFIGILYHCLDEICGLFTDLYDPDKPYVTTKIEFQINKIVPEIFLQNKQSEFKFVCVVQLKSTNGKQIFETWDLYLLSTDKSKYQSIIAGESSFQRSKVHFPHTKF